MDIPEYWKGKEKEYASLYKFNEGLLNSTSKLGKIVSSESIRKSSQHMEDAMIEAMVNSGAAVILI